MRQPIATHCYDSQREEKKRAFAWENGGRGRGSLGGRARQSGNRKEPTCPRKKKNATTNYQSFPSNEPRSYVCLPHKWVELFGSTARYTRTTPRNTNDCIRPLCLSRLSIPLRSPPTKEPNQHASQFAGRTVRVIPNPETTQHGPRSKQAHKPYAIRDIRGEQIVGKMTRLQHWAHEANGPAG